MELFEYYLPTLFQIIYYKTVYHLTPVSPKSWSEGWLVRLIGKVRLHCSSSSTLFKHLLLTNHWANQSNFIWSFYGIGERKFVQTVMVTWPRWPPCPYMVETFKNLLLWNQKADDLETWYAALGAQILPSLIKWWHWVDLDLFMARSCLVPYAFVWEKGKARVFWNYCSVWCQSW